MPDRFDLMTNDDIISAFRISAEYCRLANPARLNREKVGVLNRGELWLRNLLAELEKVVAGGPFDASVIDNPPVESGVSDEAKPSLDRFAKTNNKAHTFVTNVLLKSPKATLALAGGGKVSYLDLAKHAARISNVTSVEQRWIWK